MLLHQAAVFVANLSAAIAATLAAQEPHDFAQAQVRLAQVEAHDGVKSGELRVVAPHDGTLIAWIEGQGASIALLVLDDQGNVLASDEPETIPRPARVELETKTGSTLVIHWEASAAEPWGWLCGCARVACENEITQTAMQRARDAYRAANELEKTNDVEAQRAVLEGVITELQSMPNASTSRAVANGLWSLVFSAFSVGALDSALAAAVEIVEIRSRFEPSGSPLVQGPRIGVANVLSELTREADSVFVAAEVEARYARSLSADDTELAKVRLNLANSLRRTGELDRPARLVADALAVYECRLPLQSPERQRGMSLAATLDRAQGRTEQAAARYRDIYRCALDSKDEDDILIAGGNYAIALSDSGELELARQIEEGNLIRAELRLPKSHPGLISLRENLGVTLLNLGDLPRARALLELALAPYDGDASLDPNGLMRVLCNLAELERQCGNFARARELLERALTLTAALEDKNAAAMPLNGLAQTMMAANDPQGAQKILEKLVALRLSTLGEANVYTQSARTALADCLRVEGACAQSIELGERAVLELAAILPPTDFHAFEARLVVLGARIQAADLEHARAGLISWQQDLARHLARESLNASPRSAEERAYSWRDPIGASIGLALALGGGDHVADASLALLETCRASSLWSANALRLASESDDAQSSRAEIARLSHELSRASATAFADTAQLSRVIAAKDDAERRLLAGLTASSADVPWGEQLNLDRVRATLAASSAALSFATVAGQGIGRVESNHVAAFVLRPALTTQLIDLGPEPTLAAAVLAWRQALGTEGTAALSNEQQRATGEAVRRIIFDPLRTNLSGVDKLFVAQDGAFNLIAIDSLPDADKVIGDSFSVRYVPTLAVLASAAAPRMPAGEVVLIGGLDYGVGSLPALTGADAEVERLADVYRAAHRELRVLRARDVDRDTFAAALRRATVLHIATHGELSPPSAVFDGGARGPGKATHAWSPSQSLRELSPLALCGLALSGANELNLAGERAGFVRGVELASMDASQCELVVLSACDSRAGVERPGLAVASLEKAMHLAGARSVLASLWQVDDAQGRDLMIEFHRGLVERSLSSAEALWRAKSLLRSRRAPTRAWAGWILSSVDTSEHE